MEQKKSVKFNVVDIAVVILLILAVIFAGWRILNSEESTVEETIPVKYTVRVENVANEVYENCQRYIPSQLMAGDALYDGWIVAVRSAPQLQLGKDGEWVEDPNRVVLYFDVECYVTKEEVMTTEVGTQEVRVGKSGHILKSEYIELGSCVIVDVTWNADLSIEHSETKENS